MIINEVNNKSIGTLCILILFIAFISFRSVIVRIFKQLKLVLVRAKTPVYSNSVVDTVFSELLKKARCFFEITQNTNDVEVKLKIFCKI